MIYPLGKRQVSYKMLKYWLEIFVINWEMCIQKESHECSHEKLQSSKINSELEYEWKMSMFFISLTIQCSPVWAHSFSH